VKLANRISLFFLAALAVVLLGFSGSIYWLVRSHLFNQLDGVTQSAFETLNVAVEFTPHGLEWDVIERKIVLDQPDDGSIVWAVYDNEGQRIDGSKNPSPALLPNNQTLESVSGTETTIWNGESWKITRRLIRADSNGERASVISSAQEREANTKQYPSLIIAVGTPLTYIASQLRNLALVLAGLSALIWISAAILGRWLCRNALAPLTQMQESMATISAADLNQRLQTARTGDELEGLARTFNELLDRLQISFDRERRFAAEASHQLRTPLTAMQGQVDVALRRDRTPDEYRDAFHIVREQTARLRRIVEMLLFLTRDESDSLPGKFVDLELNEWLAKHLASWQQHLRYNDIQIQAEPMEKVWINAHDGLLAEVVDNLLDNACKYSAENSPIVVRTFNSPVGPSLVVEDNGHGIQEDELARVMDPFFRSSDAQRRGIEGSGLGLSIVHRIIGAFGAKMFVESRIGRGSIFKVIFRPPAEARGRFDTIELQRYVSQS
jgi:two-component system, OmpR family, sensor kinase